MCARLDAGPMRCWGQDDLGQFGDGTLGPDRPSPAPGPALEGVRQISLGCSNGCARLEAGTLRCWGEDAVGQFGLGTISDELTLFPTTVPGLPPQ